MLDKLLGSGRITAQGTVLVIGLGRFGSAAARQLTDLRVPVLGVDTDPALVARMAAELPHVMVLDSTDEDALAQVGLDHVDTAIVSVADVETSTITVLKLKEAGIAEVWAKASSRTHGEVLSRIGADHVIYPEASAGRRVARMVADHLLDYFELDDGFGVAHLSAPPSVVGKSLAEAGIRTRHHVTVVGVKRPGVPFEEAVPETVIQENDQLVVTGTSKDLDAFSRLS